MADKVLTAEQVREAWMKIGGGPGAAVAGWYEKLARALDGPLNAHLQAARVEAAAKMRATAVKTLCEWCAQGNVAEVRQEWRANDGSTHWHRVYDNWLACQASRIHAMPLPDAPTDALERIVEEAFNAGAAHQRKCDYEFQQHRPIPPRPTARALLDARKI